MTVDEAKTKWCPHVREADENHGSYNRWNKWVTTRDEQNRPHHKKLDELAEGCLCIASECMAWRTTVTGSKQVSCGPQGGYKKVDIVSGHCGLAGKP